MSCVDIIDTWKQVQPRKYRGALLSISLCLGILLLLPGEAKGLHKTGEKWPNGEIPVCWRSDAFAHSYHKSNARMIRDIVENNWGPVADIRFTGWGVCPGPLMSEPNGTIAIHWEDDDVNKGPRADIGYYSYKRTFIRLVPIATNATNKSEAEA